MSGDSINNLKQGIQLPLDNQDLEYTRRLLEPFDDVVVEKFTTTTKTAFSNVFVLVAISLVLFINFPKMRHKIVNYSGVNEYLLWTVSAFILFGAINY